MKIYITFPPACLLLRIDTSYLQHHQSNPKLKQLEMQLPCMCSAVKGKSTFRLANERQETSSFASSFLLVVILKMVFFAGDHKPSGSIGTCANPAEVKETH